MESEDRLPAPIIFGDGSLLALNFSSAFRSINFGTGSKADRHILYNLILEFMIAREFNSILATDLITCSLQSLSILMVVSRI